MSIHGIIGNKKQSSYNGAYRGLLEESYCVHVITLGLEPECPDDVVEIITARLIHC